MNGIFKRLDNKYTGNCTVIDNGDIYEGDLKNGIKDGDGNITYKDGSKYDGEWKDGYYHGYGVWFMKNYDRWELDKMHKKRRGPVFPYRSCCGRYSSDYKLKYEGNFKEGFRHGYGKMIYKNGCKYEGEWENDRENGHGVFTWSQGSTYEGNCRSTYEGECINGVRHGHGVYICANGDKYDGEWKDDKRHGYGCYAYTRTYHKMKKKKGQWVDGKKQGVFKCIKTSDNTTEYEYYIDDILNREKTKEFNKKIEKLRLTKILSKYFGGDCYAGEMLKSIGY